MVKRPKYGNKKTIVGGIIFASKAEAKYYSIFKRLEDEGKITNLELQKKFPITINGNPVKIRTEKRPNGTAISYYADFHFFDVKENRYRTVDIKGYHTQVSKVKIAIVESIYSICVEIIK